MFEGITPVHLIIVLVIALLILGPGKLPETGAALGKAFREFRHGLTDASQTTPTSTVASTGTTTQPDPTASPPPPSEPS